MTMGHIIATPNCVLALCPAYKVTPYLHIDVSYIDRALRQKSPLPFSRATGSMGSRSPPILAIPFPLPPVSVTFSWSHSSAALDGAPVH